MPEARTALPLPKNEPHRLAALRRLRLLDTPRELAFDRLTRLAARVGGVPMAAVALLDRDRNWFKSAIGVPVREVPRDQAFCTFTVAEGSTLIVPDVTADRRFDGLQLAGAQRRVRFYAGAPVHSPDGACVGTLCLMDSVPRPGFGGDDRANLRDIARLVEEEIGRHAEAELPMAEDSTEIDWNNWL
jgi:GAF domain-containing protein